MIKKLNRIIVSVVLLLVCTVSYSQTGNAYGSYSPYSIFGIGDISKEGTAYNKSMGGVGIAARNKRFVNILNPASVTARDTLSFMLDFGVSQKNNIYAQKLDGGKITSGSNTFNVYDFVMSFPVYRSSAIMLGITPFSDVGYDFSYRETDPQIIGNTGNIGYTNYGEGSVYQAFIGAGATFWKRLSIGAEFIGYFGSLDKVYTVDFSESSYGSVNGGHSLVVRGMTGKFGVQYDQKLGSDMYMTLGATYRLRSRMRGDTDTYQYVNRSEVTDTIFNYSTSNRGLRISDELGVGIALRKSDKWSVEVDYVRSDWSTTGIGSAEGFSAEGFSATASHSIRAGFEIVPNRNDIRYYLKRCTYRAGVYYDRSYYKFDGNRVESMGLTLGFTLPVFRLYNGITVGVDVGQKGSLRNGMVRERYAMFVVGFNIHDIWFQKPKYE